MFTCVLGRSSYSHNYQYPNFSEGSDRVGGQLCRDKECPFSGVTSSGRVWRKVPESDARSVPLTLSCSHTFSVSLSASVSLFPLSVCLLSVCLRPPLCLCLSLSVCLSISVSSLTLSFSHTPSIAFRHLPAIFGYATEGALFISAQLSTDEFSALRKVRVLR